VEKGERPPDPGEYAKGSGGAGRRRERACGGVRTKKQKWGERSQSVTILSSPGDTCSR